MEQQNFFMRAANDSLKRLLPSPFHFLASSRAMLITVIGRKSGKPITFPVNYVRQGAGIIVISRKDRTWWKNLRGGASVTLWLAGKQVTAWGTVVEDIPGVVAVLANYVQGLSRVPRRYRGDLTEAAQTRVIAQFKLGA